MKSAPSKVHFFANLNLLMLFCSFQQRINCLMTSVFRDAFIDVVVGQELVSIPDEADVFTMAGVFHDVISTDALK